MQFRASLQNYFELTKPRTWLLLVFTAFGAMVVASGGESIPYATMVFMLTAVTTGSAGANTLTCYIDRDIDAVMNRTKLRPLPTRRIQPAIRALYFGIILAGLSLIISYMINPLSFILMSVGLTDNVIVYSRFLKKRNPLSIVLGGFSGGMPVLIGYASLTNTIDLISITMAGLVVLWIPSHIWSLALYSKDDYQNAGIPMLPVVTGESQAVRCIASTSILMVFFSIIPFHLGTFGVIYVLTALALGVAILAISFWLLANPSKKNAWILFKFSSPYLALLFVAMIFDNFIR